MKKSFLFLTIAFFASLAFALPGVQSYLPDVSGQYVYYKDTTFERESYTGFLFYDEGTYAIRYYAPEVKSKKNPLAEKELCILFTMDSTKPYIDLTGERIISPVTQNDTDLINYIHDILYELTERRQKIPLFTDKTTIRDDYDQFGGKVTMTFDALIPIFNLKSIMTVDNKIAFSLVTAGQLASSEDTSFFDFKGMPSVLTDKRHSFKKKKSTQTDYAYSATENVTQKIQLDSQWTQSMDNLWLLEDSAVLAVDIIKMPPEAENNSLSLLKRRMLLGTDHSYPDLNRLSITTDVEKTTIDSVHYKPNTESATQDFKILTTLKDGSVAFFTLTVFSGAYTKNKSYFKKILASYNVEQN